MRGLKKNGMGRGQSQSEQHRNRLTLRLLDQLGPEGRVGEKKTEMSRGMPLLTIRSMTGSL